MKKTDSAMSALRAAVDAYKADAARVNESEEARLVSLEAARRCRDEAMQEDRLDDYRFYCERVHYFEGMRFEIVPPDFGEEIAAILEEYGDRIDDACRNLAAAVVDRIEREAEILKLLDGCPSSGSSIRQDEEIVVRALVAAGYLSASDWYWFWKTCHDRKMVRREDCSALLAEETRLMPMISSVWPGRGYFGRLLIPRT